MKKKKMLCLERLSAEIVPDHHQQQARIKHDCPWPGEPEVDGGESLEILDEEEDETGCETYQADLLFRILLHRVHLLC